MIQPDAALSFCRCALDSAALFLWGGAGFLGWLAPPRLCIHLTGKLRIWQIAAALAAMLATLAMLPLKTAYYGDGWLDAADPALLANVLLSTHDGRVWMAQIAAALLLAAIVIIVRAPSQRLIATAAGLLLASLCFTGHAAMQAGWLGIAHRLALLAHLLSAGAWIGALAPVLLALRALKAPELWPDATLSLARISAAGHAAVAVAIATGLVNIGLILGRLPLEWSVTYQMLLSLKIALVLAMVCLALANRYLLVPRLNHRTGRALMALQVGTLAEIALALVVLALVASFGMLDPTGAM